MALSFEVIFVLLFLIFYNPSFKFKTSTENVNTRLSFLGLFNASPLNMDGIHAYNNVLQDITGPRPMPFLRFPCIAALPTMWSTLPTKLLSAFQQSAQSSLVVCTVALPSTGKSFFQNFYLSLSLAPCVFRLQRRSLETPCHSHILKRSLPLITKHHWALLTSWILCRCLTFLLYF